MKLTKWLAALLAACLLLSAIPSAMMEAGELTTVPVDAPQEEVGPGEILFGTSLPEDGDDPELIDVEIEDEEEDEEEADGEEEEEPAPAFARIADDGASLYDDAEAETAVATIAGGAVVLALAEANGRARIAYCEAYGIEEAYADAGDVTLLDVAETAAYLDAAALAQVALYGDDMAYPLLPADVTAIEAPEEEEPEEEPEEEEPEEEEPVEEPEEAPEEEGGEEEPETELPFEEETPEEEPEEEPEVVTPVEEAPVETETVEIETLTEGTEEPVDVMEPTDDPNAAAPAVKSAKTKSTTVNAGATVTFTVTTETGATVLAVYDAKGAKLKTWKAADCAKKSGKTLIWTVKYQFTAGDVYKLTFKASADGSKMGAGKSLTMTVRPSVLSIKLKKNYLPAGKVAIFTVRSDPKAKYLHCYNADGELTDTYRDSDISKLSSDGKARIWRVARKYGVGGVRRLSFKASLDGRNPGKGKKVLLTVTPTVRDVTLKPASMNAGNTTKITVKTDACAKYLHLYSSAGKLLKTWARADYSKLSTDKKTRIWTVTRKYSVGDTYKLKFKASLDKKHTGITKTVLLTVKPSVRSVAMKSASVFAGKDATFTVKTDPKAKYLHAYDAANKTWKVWSAADNSKLSTDKKTRIWTVKRNYVSGGTHKLTFKASLDKKKMGLGKTVVQKVRPKVRAVKSATKVKKGKTLTITVTTDKAAKYLFMYASGTKLKTWGTKYSTVSGTSRIWKVKYKFTKAGKRKYTFKSSLSDKKVGAGKSVTINCIYDPVKYRALLIGEESFSPVCHRNRGDVNIMKEMLQTVKGPTGGQYAITTKFDRSKDQVLADIKAAYKGANANDVSLFFIATHGDVSCSEYYYPEYAGCLSMLPETGYYEDQLRLDVLAEALAAVPGKVIVILESCGSGAAVYDPRDTENKSRLAMNAAAAFDAAAIKAFANADPGILVDEDGETLELNDLAANGDAVANIGDFRVDNKFYVLTASRYREESWGHEDGDSSFNYFTVWFVMGVVGTDDYDADYNHDGKITLNEAFKGVDYCGKTLGSDMQHVQVYPKNSSYALFKR